MPKTKNFTISPKTSLLECLRQLDSTGCHILACIEQSRVTGVVSEGDIRRGIINGIALDQPVGPLINGDPVVVRTPYDPVDVIALMRKRRIDGIPVINEKDEFVEFLTFSSLLNKKDLPNTAVIMAG
ncbi:MAG: CBS domain-containing protein, partial [Alphaproteobacteria bacterium]|nr:CBS domain-containing protein [Alphaproteobacteria bacterium]